MLYALSPDRIQEEEFVHKFEIDGHVLFALSAQLYLAHLDCMLNLKNLTLILFIDEFEH